MKTSIYVHLKASYRLSLNIAILTAALLGSPLRLRSAISLPSPAPLPPSSQGLPYQDPSLSARERALDLCSRLTLEEKALLMLDESPAIPRLGIRKFYWWSEALHGAANQGNVTVFPEPIAMAASWNPDLLYKVFDVASTEFRAQYNKRMLNGGEDEKFHSLSVWTPNVNIFRDPRWGRGQETYGEDPYLTSVMGTQVVRGLQGPETAKYRKLWACAKHYAVHSGPEYTRHTANLNNVSLRDLWETYLPAFKTLVQDAKVREVMCAYQRLDDEPCCGNTQLLQQILRDEWGFQYLVVSDCGAISDFHQNHKSSSDKVHAAKVGALAGTDVECGWDYVYRSIPEAVRRGFLTEAEVDKHVVRLLEGRFDLGEMDDPALVEWSRIPYSAMSTQESAQKALEMARQTIVLLKNDNHILPLKAGKERIAVIGPNADNRTMMWGNYNGTPNHTVTILDGICNELKIKKERLKNKGSQLVYLPGCDLVNDKVMDGLMDSQCQQNGRKGLRGTFWNNTRMEGKPVTTQYYTSPVAVTTAGFHNFAPNVGITDFSARYETTFTPTQSGEYVVNVEGTGHFEVFVNGEQKQKQHTWRTTPTRTVLQAEAGKPYQIEVRYAFVPGWGADLKINVAKEEVINYQVLIDRLQGVPTVVFVGGISPALEGEEMPVNVEGFRGGDRTDIELPRVQREFLKALKAAGKRVIFVNCSGSAIALTPETQSCDAILQAWYAGQEGGTAVADVLFGRVNPSGKLPVTFYRSSEQLPDYEDYSMRGRTYRYFDAPLYAFGYGLSFTQFELKPAEIQTKNGAPASAAAPSPASAAAPSAASPASSSPSSAVPSSSPASSASPSAAPSAASPASSSPDSAAKFSFADNAASSAPLPLRLSSLDARLLVPVANTGRRDGTEVVQLYVRDLADSEGPLKSLRGFCRLTVKAGQTATAVLPLTPKTFELFDPATNTVHAHPGRYELLYGNSSRPADLQRIEVELQ